MRPEIWIAIVSAAAALGIWLILPRGSRRGVGLGAGLVIAALAAMFVQAAPWLNDLGAEIVLWPLTILALGAGLATIATPRPVYSAIWFAIMLLATSGLLVYQGAQFLGLATVVVYAGAILVTFLFVLMLATPLGTAVYDRISWEGLMAGVAGAALVGFVSYLLGNALPPSAQAPSAGSPPAAIAQEQLAAGVLAPAHMAHLGEQLFSTHLLAVEVAGTLLMVGLVGAVAIAAHEHGPRPEASTAEPAAPQGGRI